MTNHPFDARHFFADLTTQDKVFANQTGAFETTLHGIQHLRQREGLEQKIRCPRPQRIDGRIEIGIGRHEHNITGETLIAQLMQPFDAGPAWQRDIKHDQVVQPPP